MSSISVSDIPALARLAAPPGATHHDADTLPAGQGIGIGIGAFAPARCAPQRPVTASWRASFRGARPSPQVRFSVRALLVFRPRRASSPTLFRIRMDEEPDRSRFQAMRAMPERVLARSRDARVALRAFGRREPPPFPQAASGYAFHGCDVLQRAMRWWAAPTACRRPGRNEQRTTVSEHPRGGRLPGAVRELETEGGSCARRTIGRAGVSPPMPRMGALIDRQGVVIDDFGRRMETDLAPPGALFTGDAGLPEDGAAAPEPDSPRTAPARPARHSTRACARITDRHRERRDADADHLRPPS